MDVDPTPSKTKGGGGSPTRRRAANLDLWDGLWDKSRCSININKYHILIDFHGGQGVRPPCLYGNLGLYRIAQESTVFAVFYATVVYGHLFASQGTLGVEMGVGEFYPR